MEKHMDIIKHYTYDDFATQKPYEYIYNFKGSPFEREQLLAELKKRAADVGYKNFSKMYKSYIATRELDNKTEPECNVTEFPDQPYALDCGDWTADAEGVRRMNSSGVYEYACRHPIMLAARLEDYDSKTTQFVLGYRMPGEAAEWQELVFDNLDLSTTNGIIKLSAWGIDVTSNSASKLMAYLNDLRMLNYDRIPKHSSIKHLGYIDGVGFAPYTDKVVFGAAAEFRSLYEAIGEKGSFEDWLKVAKRCRDASVPAHIMLAASFAAPVLKIVGSLPFFVHLWNSVGGSGKTVCLMLAASIWGNPELGRYIQTLNATQVGMEKTAAFLDQLPYCMDELQLSKDSNGKTKIDVYQLAEGIGRTRGNKSGGVDATSRWHCCFLTTGESPITNIKRGSGAVNRVIDIGCSADKPVVPDGPTVVPILKANYGHAGRVFVSKLYEYEATQDSVRITYSNYRRKLEDAGATGKQAMAAAVILTASELASYWIFKDNKKLEVEDIIDYLATDEAASLGNAAYVYLKDWVAQNANRFISGTNTPNNEIYGIIKGGEAMIIRKVFDEALEKVGYDSMAVLRYLRDEKMITVREGKGFTISTRIGENVPECVALQLVHFGGIHTTPNPELPF